MVGLVLKVCQVRRHHVENVTLLLMWCSYPFLFCLHFACDCNLIFLIFYRYSCSVAYVTAAGRVEAMNTTIHFSLLTSARSLQ